jgi:hypothetical protein
MTRDVRLREKFPAPDQKFLAAIETYGWHVTNVFNREGDSGPEWSYSTGLFHSCAHPEVVIFGLELNNMQKIINRIGDLVKNGSKFEPGNEYFEILAGYGCRFRELSVVHYRSYLGWSIWFYERDPFPVLQCFWPDKEGRYPWQPECSPAVVARQPLLFSPS